MIALALTRQILVFFIMMGCGFTIVKAKLLKSEDSRTLSILSIYLITPCVMLKAFQIEYTREIRNGFLLAILAAVIIHIALFLLCGILNLLFRFEPVEKASLIYSNAGNLIIPLISAVLGDEWVIYASAFVCVQNLIMWTHGQSLMRGMKQMNLRRMLCNINLISIFTGLLLFFTGIRFPALLMQTISNFASIIGPVSMILLGMILARVKWKEVFRGYRIYLIVTLKMIVFPLVMLCILKFSPLSTLVPDGQTILLISLLATITPSATTVTQMAVLYDQNGTYASAINALTTVVCIATMPVMIMLYLH